MDRRIAVTGGIGSGKSLVSKYLRKYGYSVFSCDEIYKEIIKTPEYISKIKSVFPSVVDGGGVDVKKLSEIVFSDKCALAQLNKIAHPIIMQELFQKMQNCKGVCFAEVPLLFESGFEDAFDEIIVIMRNKEKRIKDVCERDNITRGQVLKRMQAQVDYDSEELRLKINRLGGYIIENEKDVAFLETQIKDIVKQLS